MQIRRHYGDQDDFDSKNELTVPVKVIREASLNLLTHRTWWSEAMTPSVAIFDDRIEFMNPGAFPSGTTPEEFRKRPHSLPINEKIAGALFKGGKSEGWGRGILNIFTYCKEAGLPEPEYDFVTHFVCLTIKFKAPLTPRMTGDTINDTIKPQLDQEELSVYLLVKANPGIRRKAIAEKTGKSIATIARLIIELQEKDFIEHRGSNKTGGYYAK